jgi:hypothetical protein
MVDRQTKKMDPKILSFPSKMSFKNSVSDQDLQVWYRYRTVPVRTPKISTWVGRTARALTLGTFLVLRDWMMGRTKARVLPG